MSEELKITLTGNKFPNDYEDVPICFECRCKMEIMTVDKNYILMKCPICGQGIIGKAVLKIQPVYYVEFEKGDANETL